MQIKKIKELLDAEVIWGETMLEEEVEYGYGCDLMSDVLAYVENDIVLLTGLVHPQVIRTAEMLDIKAIVIVRGKQIGEEVIRMVKTRDIALLLTKHSLFSASGILYANGLSGEENAHETKL
jgi:predicted transcriptional regulator